MADEIIKIDPVSERAFSSDGVEHTADIYVYCRRRAYEKGKDLRKQIIKTGSKRGQYQYRMVEKVLDFDIEPFLNGSTKKVKVTNKKTKAEPEVKVDIVPLPRVKAKSIGDLLEEIKPTPIDAPSEDELVDFILNSNKIKPKFLKMSNLKWKLLVRTVLRSKNIMMVGPSGEGKTLAVHALKAALGRPFFYMNMGNTQDAQTALIGKTHFDKSKGTYFEPSYFVKAIQTPNAIILLDELSRQSDDASNIMMPVLDENQRYLRLSEDAKSELIEVAKGVTFVATANIGNEFTTTQVMDRALLDRFVRIEVDTLNKKDKTSLLKEQNPNVNVSTLKDLADLSEKIRSDYESDAPTVNTLLSTRMCVETASLIADGFSLVEASEASVYPFFDKEGGAQSARTFVKQIVQSYTDHGDKDASELFGTEDFKTASTV